MENGQNVNASTTDRSLMKPLDQKERVGSQNDIMNRRLKNRERQRRYRARKRLEADMEKACIINQSTPLQVEMQVNGIPQDCVSRIHCQRDWKKDARRAHLSKDQEVKSNGPVIPDPMSTSGSQAPSLPSGVKEGPSLNGEFHPRSSPILDCSETHRITPSRRHWKVEARNKNS